MNESGANRMKTLKIKGERQQKSENRCRTQATSREAHHHQKPHGGEVPHVDSAFVIYFTFSLVFSVSAKYSFDVTFTVNFFFCVLALFLLLHIWLTSTISNTLYKHPIRKRIRICMRYGMSKAKKKQKRSSENMLRSQRSVRRWMWGKNISPHFHIIHEAAMYAPGKCQSAIWEVWQMK